MIAQKLAGQVGVMFLLMAIGVFIRKKGIVSVESARQFSNFALFIITPALLVNVFQRDFHPEMAASIALSALLVAVFHLLAALLTRPLFPHRGDGDDRSAVARLGAISSNCGFMGIPLMTAAMGEDSMIFAAIYIGIFNIYIWSHGVMLLRRDGRIRWKEILLSPGVLGASLGVLLYLLQIRLPGLLLDTLGFLSGMNTPLPMVITGVLIADLAVGETLRDLRLYFTAFVRLVGLPLVMLGLMLLARVPGWFDGAPTVVLAMVISVSCPVAISTVMMPTRFGGDAQYGAKLVALSTLLSIFTIPAVASLAQWAMAQGNF